jgi:hypothetical protein
MRIRDLICSFALLAAAVDSEAKAQAVDPNSDFDCAIVFQFYHRMAEARNAPADERELTLVMNAWFVGKWEREHPGEGPKQFDHYAAIVTALGNDPNAYRETIRTCSGRATSDPAFGPFWMVHGKAAPGSR